MASQLTARKGTAKRKSGTATRTMPREEQDDLSSFSGRLGAAIRKKRKAKGWSRTEFAERVTDAGHPLTETAIRSYENGNRPIPVNALPAIASALRCSIASLMPSQ